MPVVVDSTPLICLAKIGKLQLLRSLYGRVFVPGAVYREVINEGKRLRKPEVHHIENGVTDGWIETIALDEAQRIRAGRLRGGQTGSGEAEALALASDRGLPIILDDRHARELARMLELDFVGSAAVLLLALRRGHIDQKGFFKALEDLGNVMWLSPQVIARLVQLAGEVEQ